MMNDLWLRPVEPHETHGWYIVDLSGKLVATNIASQEVMEHIADTHNDNLA